MERKRLFIQGYVRGSFEMAELCCRYGISRPTGYKWIELLEAVGLPGLEGRSRRPGGCSHETAIEITEAVLELRRKHPYWGAKKLLTVLGTRHPNVDWPARSTVCDLLSCHGMIDKKRRRKDPGRPGKPQQNGRHERMHKTLKQGSTRPAAKTMRGQQRRFDRFVKEFNDERPHEALGQETPGSRYAPSPRDFPSKLPPIEYPAHFEKRLMSHNGGFRWASKRVPISHLLEGQYIGLEEVGDGIWGVDLSDVKLGRMDERILRAEDALGRRMRNPQV